MEIKKSKVADLEGKRTTWFLLGLILVLSVLFVAFEYTERSVGESADVSSFDELSDNVDLMPITKQPDNRIPFMPSKVPTRKVATRIAIVDNAVGQSEGVELSGSSQQLENGDGAGPEAKEGEEQTQALSPVATDMKDNPLNFHVVEDLPQFPGGAVEFMKWLTKNLRYPAAAQRQKIEGKVVVQFILNKDGTVSSLKVVKPLNADCDHEALRVMRMMPKWKPGVQNDKPCRTMVCIPIIFKL